MRIKPYSRTDANPFVLCNQLFIAWRQQSSRKLLYIVDRKMRHSLNIYLYHRKNICILYPWLLNVNCYVLYFVWSWVWFENWLVVFCICSHNEFVLKGESYPTLPPPPKRDFFLFRTFRWISIHQSSVSVCSIFQSQWNSMIFPMYFAFFRFILNSQIKINTIGIHYTLHVSYLIENSFQFDWCYLMWSLFA